MSKTDPRVPPDHLWGMLIYSVRYAMGRRSYAVGEVCDWVRAYSKHLMVNQVEQIAREVAEELQKCESQDRHLGMAQDHRDWAHLVAYLRNEATLRSEQSF